MTEPLPLIARNLIKLTLNSAILVLLLVGQGWAFDEVCGDGVDNDSVGGDVLCPTDTFPSGCIDQDRDGYCSNTSTGPNAGIDCDDTNRYIYPGIATKTGCTSNEARLCGTGGTYGSCSIGGYCPAGYTCYYFDDTGNDTTGAGTFANPWKTPNMFSSRSTGSPPAGFITPGASKAFIFRGGTYGDDFVTNTKKYWLTMSNRTGSADGTAIIIMGYPDEWPLVDSVATDVTPFNIIGCSFVKVSGFEVSGNTCSNSYDAGCVGFIEGSDNEVFNMKVHGNTGITNNNMAGLFMHSEARWDAHHNLSYDNVGDNTASGNNCNILTYRGTDTVVTDNVTYFTTNTGGFANYRKKHCNDDSSDTYLRNVAINGSAIFCTPTITAKNNYIDTAHFALGDSGGPAFFENGIFQYNTVRNGRLFVFDYTKSYANADGSSFAADRCTGLPASLVSISFRDNVAQKTTADTTDNNRSWNIGTYLPESNLYTEILAGMDLGDNVYDNTTGAVTFGLFEANNGDAACGETARGSSGASYSLSGIQAAPASFESGSIDINPSFTTEDHVAECVGCTGKGWNQQWGTYGAPSATSRRKGSKSGSSRKGQS